VELCLHTHYFEKLSLTLSLFGPALIAAFHGLASQLECKRLQRRAESMVKILAAHKERLEALDLSSQPASAQAVWGLSTEALTVASVMMDETATWSLLYKNADIHAG
jgi:hypothetical protein